MQLSHTLPVDSATFDEPNLVSSAGLVPLMALAEEAGRLRKGAAGSPRGAVRLATDALAMVRRTCLAGRPVLVRGDAAFYSHALVTAVLKTGAEVSITVRMDPAVKRAKIGRASCRGRAVRAW